MPASKIDAMWDEAFNKYKEVAKEDLKNLPRPRSADALIQQVKEANKEYKEFRKRSEKPSSVLSAMAKPIETIANLTSCAATQAFPRALWSLAQLCILLALQRASRRN